MRRILFSLFVVLSFTRIHAQAEWDNINFKPSKLNISVTDLNMNVISGLLLSSTDTSVKVYPSSYRDWKRGKTRKILDIPFRSIYSIQVYKRNAVIEGSYKGIDIFKFYNDRDFLNTPYNPFTILYYGIILNVIALPVAVVTGTIGRTVTRKKYTIAGNTPGLEKFRKRMRRIGAGRQDSI